MDVGIAIGENHRFELREALLIYCENRNAAFVTRHQVLQDKPGIPSLGPAQPLTVDFVEELVRSFEGRTATEILPENILAKTNRMIAWWTPNGTLCTGSMRRPSGTSAATMALWERGFFESAFTHSNVGRLTRHPGGFEGLWSGLAGKRAPFPADTLIELPQTLRQFVGGER